MFGVVNRKVVVFVSAEAWNREQDHVKSIVMAVKESQIGLVLPAQGLIVGCYQVRFLGVDFEVVCFFRF